MREYDMPDEAMEHTDTELREDHTMDDETMHEIIGLGWAMEGVESPEQHDASVSTVHPIPRAIL